MAVPRVKNRDPSAVVRKILGLDENKFGDLKALAHDVNREMTRSCTDSNSRWANAQYSWTTILSYEKDAATDKLKEYCRRYEIFPAGTDLDSATITTGLQQRLAETRRGWQSQEKKRARKRQQGNVNKLIEVEAISSSSDQGRFDPIREI